MSHFIYVQGVEISIRITSPGFSKVFIRLYTKKLKENDLNLNMDHCIKAIAAALLYIWAGGGTQMQVYTCMNNGFEYTPKLILVMMEKYPINKILWDFALNLIP